MQGEKEANFEPPCAPILWSLESRVIKLLLRHPVSSYFLLLQSKLHLSFNCSFCSKKWFWLKKKEKRKTEKKKKKLERKKCWKYRSLVWEKKKWFFSAVKAEVFSVYESLDKTAQNLFFFARQPPLEEEEEEEKKVGIFFFFSLFSSVGRISPSARSIDRFFYFTKRNRKKRKKSFFFRSSFIFCLSVAIYYLKHIRKKSP